MRRRALIASLVAAAFVLTAPSPALAQPRLLMPGVTYERQLQFTPAGPVVLHVLRAPRPGGLWSLRAVLANEAIVGLERLTAMQQRLSPSATVAGVNGDRFAADGRPSGVLLRGGVLDHQPLPSRSSIGVDETGTLRVERVRLFASWQGAGPRRPFALVNDLIRGSGVALYTPAWGPATPPAPGSLEAVLRPFPAARPNVELSGPVAGLAAGGGTPIPPDGAVLVAKGAAAGRLQAEAPVGQLVRIRLVLHPAWDGVVQALGGGPLLVRGGRVVLDAGEAFSAAQLARREPRSAVGQTADGGILLVVADGRSLGYATGISTFDLALAMARLGAVTAAALDGGGSSAMAFEGRLLNRPADAAGERPIADALLVAYEGVQVPAPSEPVLSPNGDGVGERQLLVYKVVRPSAVMATLTGPDGVARSSFSGQVEPGVYTLEWSGLREDGAPEPEGRWTWAVSAVDDLGRSSAQERSFDLNLTLGFARAVGPALVVPRPRPRAVAVAQLTRAARVTARIETLSGALLRRLPPQELAPGTVRVAWDGRTDTGSPVYSGRYVARISAVNELGTVSLAVAFLVRRSGAGGAARR